MATWLLGITDCQYYAMSIFRVVHFSTGCTFVVFVSRYNLWYGKEPKHNLLISCTTGVDHFNPIKIRTCSPYSIGYEATTKQPIKSESKCGYLYSITVD